MQSARSSVRYCVWTVGRVLLAVRGAGGGDDGGRGGRGGHRRRSDGAAGEGPRGAGPPPGAAVARPPGNAAWLRGNAGGSGAGKLVPRQLCLRFEEFHVFGHLPDIFFLHPRNHPESWFPTNL